MQSRPMTLLLVVQFHILGGWLRFIRATFSMLCRCFVLRVRHLAPQRRRASSLTPPRIASGAYFPQVRAALQQSFPSFEVVEFRGDGTIVSQLEAFATASVVVGPHGAGLSNTVVSSLHTPVLEIAPISCSTCFLHLAIKVLPR